MTKYVFKIKGMPENEVNVTEFTLDSDDGENVVLRANGWRVLDIYPDGMMARSSDCSDETGLQLDGHGKIRLTEER